MWCFSPSWSDPFSLTYLSTCLKPTTHGSKQFGKRRAVTPPAGRPVALCFFVSHRTNNILWQQLTSYPTSTGSFSSLSSSIWHIFACLVSWPVVLLQVMLRSAHWIFFSILPGLSNGTRQSHTFSPTLHFWWEEIQFPASVSKLQALPYAHTSWMF